VLAQRSSSWKAKSWRTPGVRRCSSQKIDVRFSAKVCARQRQGVLRRFGQLMEGHSTVAGFRLVLVDFVPYEDLEAPMRLVLDVFGDGPAAGLGVLEERRPQGRISQTGLPS
jgi:hypothetical protein